MTAAMWMGAGDARSYTPTRRLREGRGWSQERLAGRAGVTVECVRRFERGEVATLTFAHGMRIANALGCSVVDLIPGLVIRHAGTRGEVGTVVRQKLEGAPAISRKVKLRAWLVELLRAHGGRMAACHVWKEFEPFGLSRQWLNLRRVECGIRTQREPGFGNRADGWIWILPPDPVSEAAASPQ